MIMRIFDQKILEVASSVGFAPLAARKWRGLNSSWPTMDRKNLDPLRPDVDATVNKSLASSLPNSLESTESWNLFKRNNLTVTLGDLVTILCPDILDFRLTNLPFCNVPKPRFVQSKMLFIYSILFTLNQFDSIREVAFYWTCPNWHFILSLTFIIRA